MTDKDQTSKLSKTEKEIQKLSKNIITELCTNAPSSDVRDCLRKFKCGIIYTYKEQYRSIQPCAKGVIIDSLKYLGLNNDWGSIKKEHCVHELVCRIQNLCPDICCMCSSLYCTKKDETSLLSCQKCGQEAHRECLLEKLKLDVDVEYEQDYILSLINPLNLQGFHYLCLTCEKDLLPDPKAGIKKSSAKKKSKISDKQPVMGSIQAADTLPISSVENSREDDEFESSESEMSSDDESDASIPGYPAIKKANKGQVVCKFFAKGICKHGISGKNCKYDHPTMCKKFINHGKSKEGCKLDKKKCKFFHPTLCRLSLSGKHCDRKKCTSGYHLKGDAHRNHSPVLEETQSVSSNAKKDFLEVLSAFKAEVLQEMEHMKFQISSILSPIPPQRVLQYQQLPMFNQVANTQAPPWGNAGNFPPLTRAPLQTQSQHP